jgi:tetratricopeptide (TPR) repeat protein
MGPGDVIAEQFELLYVAGRGGMGVVYRAKDRHTGGSVAVKLMPAGERSERFQREARALAELNHPGIVRYVAHGRTPDLEPFLAMEWLEGESLSDRLKRAGLSMRESVALTHRVAEALSAAHRRGILHRDLKPSNLFLAGGSIDRVKIVDFGIAQVASAATRLTMTGVAIGTPGYMAPEQARGERDLDTRADVFALGCILFRCLTGEPPFTGDDMLAVMLKVVLEEAPRARAIRPEIPEALDHLLARMLAKAREDRPADAAAVTAELLALPPIDDGPSADPVASAPGLTSIEQRVHCLVLARARAEAGPAETPSGTVIMRVEGADAATQEPTRALSKWSLRELAETAKRYGGRVDVLADGSLVVPLASAGAATDQAAQAARCALAMRALLGDVPIALVAGRAVVSGRSPMGEVIDRGARLLSRAGGAIYVDEVTAGLLGARFELRTEKGALVLAGERDTGGETARTLLGKPTPFVGRDRELSVLLGLFEECVSEPVARAGLITAPAGVGKSRLRYEFLSALRARGEPVEIWLGLGDPLSAGSPFGMIAQPVRRAAGILDGEPLHIRQQKLRARVGRAVFGKDLARVTEFLGELIGAPFSDDQSIELRAARHDPMLMGDQMRRAFEDWIGAECQAQPVVLVLEDLHWGDLPSVRFIDAALRNLHGSPLFVLAAARPEVYDLFPKLWMERNLQEIRLGELTKRGSERLVREVLGARATDETVSLLVRRAAGNAFYLEELIRAVAEGRDTELPETVLAMVQARLDGLESEARRVLRAASVFGQAFWRGGVMALLGGEQRTLARGDWLSILSDCEMITSRGAGKFPGEEEFIFRHALVREAAYAMLTEQDRALGHQLAGAWLEEAGERDPVVLAEHFERGGEPGSAERWYRRAAEQALEGNDLVAAQERATRGIACGAVGESLGALNLIAAEALRYRGEYFEAASSALDALSWLPHAGELWHTAVGEAALACARLGKPERIMPLVGALLAIKVSADTSDAHAIACAQTAGVLLFTGHPDLAGALFEHIDAIERAARRPDPAVLAWISRARATRLLFAGDPSAFLRLMEQTAALFEQAGDLRSACTQRVNVGYAYMQVGAYREAEGALREAIIAAERMGLAMATASAKHNLGLAVARQGRVAEGVEVERQALAASITQGDRRLEGGSRTYLAAMLALSGDLEEAVVEARTAAEVSRASPPARAYALATLAHVSFLRGEAAEGAARAAEAMELLESMGGEMEEGESLVRLVHAEALDASGDREAAGWAIGAARSRLLERAQRISDPAWRESFLRSVPENMRTLALAREWTGPE